MPTPRALLDFETRSACSLRKAGAWRYSIDPTTEVLCLAFRLSSWAPGRTALWHPDFPQIGLTGHCGELGELFDWIGDGGLVEAHNAWFERCVWRNVLEPRFGFLAIRGAQWRCSAAKAAAHALPRGLDDAATALKLALRKDAEGAKAMQKMTKPRKSRKAEREAWAKSGETPPALLWHETPDLFARLFAYCRQDILVEEAVGDALPDLSEHETAMYIMDQGVNERGFQIDADAVTTALALIEQETARLNGELAEVTGGRVKRATQRAQMLDWFQEQGLDLDDTQKATIEDALEWIPADQVTEPVRRGLTIVRTLGRSSTAKYQSMANWMGADGRVRGGLLYHGATTGRWSGSGVQPHNFVRGSVKDMEGLWAMLKARDCLALEAAHGSVMAALAEGLRGAITAGPGRCLYVADYAAIEARVLFWLANDHDALDVFRAHQDIYCEMASDIYARPISKADAQERQLGKAAVLGCGYQMGASKFVATAATYGVDIDEVFASQVVNAYRAKFWRVKQMWADQNAAAIQAVEDGEAVECSYVTWRPEAPFLFCELPSGRQLAYPFPEIRGRMTPWGAVQSALTYTGTDPHTRKWTRQTTYGGMLVENITQAVARDLMAEAMLRCEGSDTYDLVLTVHDEMIAEADEGAGSVREFEALMAEVPTWAAGCPVEAEGWTGLRYRK